MGLLWDEGMVYESVNEVDLSPRSNHVYLRANVKAPRMAGILVKVFAWFLESRIFGTLLLYFLKKDNLIHKLITNAELEESPAFVPTAIHTLNHQDHHKIIKEGEEEEEVEEMEKSNLSNWVEKFQQTVEYCLPLSSPSQTQTKPDHHVFRRWTIMDYSTAYTSAQLTPTIVAERFIAAVDDCSNFPLNMSFFINYDAKNILRQAAESTLRYEKGEPISILDGVPIAIKDEIDCSPYPTTGGTKWLHKHRSCKGDALCVMRLRSCGAILVGKTNMHELGAGTSGINPHYGATRNPYNPSRISGGSSSGSAAVVSSGLCPVALGVDGGGSVRMPAALCGVVGLKPTFGCIPHSGVIPLTWTVGMIGILAATIEDAFIVYAAISDQLSSNKQPTTTAPLEYFPLLKSTKPISDIRLAKYEEWFNDCSDEIRLCCSSALDQLCEKYNWKTVQVTIPEIEAMRLAHYLTIGSECATSLSSYLQKLNFGEIGWDTRVALSVYGAFSSKEYIKAQKIRNRQMQFHNEIFTKADVIVVPTTGVTAYPILDDALKTGELDYINGAAMVRYQIAGNFLGLPALTTPVGYDKAGMPIGLQFIGKPWSESTLIHIASAMQALRISEYRKPKVFYDLLKKE